MPHRQIIQKTPDPLHEAVGTAMAQWQAVEGTLYRAFHCILNTDQRYTAHIFFDIRSPDRKVKIVDELMHVYLGEKEYNKRAKNIFKRIFALTKERNNIAHFCVQAAVERETDKYLMFSLAMYFQYLDPNFEKQTRWEYRADDIFQLGREFMECTWPLTYLLNDLFPNERSPKESRELIVRRPQRRPRRRASPKSTGRPS